MFQFLILAIRLTARLAEVTSIKIATKVLALTIAAHKRPYKRLVLHYKQLLLAVLLPILVDQLLQMSTLLLSSREQLQRCKLSDKHQMQLVPL
jgi:hypothetical protein